MNLKILVIGDVVSNAGTNALSKRLWNFRRENGIDIAVVNGENSAAQNGIDPDSADAIISAGADVVTTGNHVWRCRSIHDYLDSGKPVIRPANYPSSSPGAGYIKVEAAGRIWLVMNILGLIYCEPLADPFDTVEKILKAEEGKYDYSILDIHAEATSEKAAIARYFDGRINVVFGTHTHVATADERILPGGTGFITDVGMSGDPDSILGVKSECIIRKLTTKMPVRFEYATGEAQIHGAVFTLSDQTGRIISAERVTF